ncbi:MAG: HAD-IIIA family hydrolase [Thermoflavifilum sp.]|nr:HAD-IIIA family hydrolase [Thermoflavifilum sp.]
MNQRVSTQQLIPLFQSIHAMVFDVDGVMTDGKLWLTDKGIIQCQMHIRDGYALQLAIKQGYRVAVISGRFSEAVVSRLQYLGITDIFMPISDKATCLKEYIQLQGLDAQRVLYMGDDVPDLPAMRMVGFPTCPADATAEVKQLAKYISHLPGGNGCVREVIEKVLKLQKKWVVSHN